MAHVQQDGTRGRWVPAGGLALMLAGMLTAGCQLIGDGELTRQQARTLVTEHLATVVDSSWAHSLDLQVETITRPSTNDRDVEFLVTRSDSVFLSVVQFRRSDEGWSPVEYKSGMTALVARGWAAKIRGRYGDLLEVRDRLFQARTRWIEDYAGAFRDQDGFSPAQRERFLFGPTASDLREHLSSELPAEVSWEVYDPQSFPAGHVLILRHAGGSEAVCYTYLGLDHDPPPQTSLRRAVGSEHGRGGRL